MLADAQMWHWSDSSRVTPDLCDEAAPVCTDDYFSLYKQKLLFPRSLNWVSRCFCRTAITQRLLTFILTRFFSFWRKNLQLRADNLKYKLNDSKTFSNDLWWVIYLWLIIFGAAGYIIYYRYLQMSLRAENCVFYWRCFSLMCCHPLVC